MTALRKHLQVKEFGNSKYFPVTKSCKLMGVEESDTVELNTLPVKDAIKLLENKNPEEIISLFSKR